MNWPNFSAPALGALCLAGCVGTPNPVAVAEKSSLAAPEERIVDSAIRADRQFLNTLQERLQNAVEKGTPADSHSYCKAQAWLDMAVNEYYENDRSGVVRAAAAESLRLIEALESNTELDWHASSLPGYDAVREDLWQFARDASGWVTTDCAGCELAKFEVQLVWIAHEMRELGWRHALPANQAAERLKRRVEAARTCASEPEPEPEVVAAPVVPPPEPAPEPDKAPETRLPHFVHFASDSSALAPQSQPRITAMAKVLNDRRDLSVRVEGYADARGSQQYNFVLARRRAEAVRAALIEQGVSGNRLSVVGIGEALPRSEGNSVVDYARNRRVELVVLDADEPVQLDLAEVDLQFEVEFE